ncbi:MAG TPA: RICIN domain-containing protein [Thermoanaerobaculia bacterium]|nr:RICIN domain-containing protein [Thermoanaerobaculia bacterium]
MATSEKTAYVIQFSANTNFCLGVTAANPGAQVTLSLLQGAGTPLTQWYIDPNSGTITLAASNPDSPLYLDFQGSTPSNGVPLIVSSFVLGRNSQRWNWLGNPPYVMNQGAPSYCIDDSNGGTQPGNRVQIWTQQNGNTNQQWQFLAVPVLEAALAVSA